MFLIGICTVAGSLYIAKKAYQKRHNRKVSKKLQREGVTRPALSSLLSQNGYKIRANDQNIILSTILLTLSFAGFMGGSLLHWSCIPLLIYLQIPIFKNGYRELFEEHKIGAGVRDSLLSITMLSLQYFLASALFLLQYFISRKILFKTEDSSQQNLVEIWGETSQFVWIEQDGVEIEISIDRLQVGNVVVVNAGEIIPVDGIVKKGIGSVAQHVLTGEAQPKEIIQGSRVFALTTLLSGKLYIRVDKTGNETIASQIQNILNSTVDYKSSQQARGEHMAEKYALPSIIGGVVTLPILGVSSAATMLLVSFGNQMRILAPISILNFLEIASKYNILIKDGRALEGLKRVDTVVFDKTGTLTEEQPHVKAIHVFDVQTENEVLCYAATAEYKQTHPIALAIKEEAQKRSLQLPKVDEANYEIGYGLKVRAGDRLIQVGSIRFMKNEGILIPPGVQELQKSLKEQGSSLVYIAVNEKLIGAIELHTTIRMEAKQVIANLRKIGMKLIIISGDHRQPTKRLSQELGISQYFAETLPNDKAQIIEQLQKEGRSVCFIGDGINDSIALKKANVSISLQGSSKLATDTAQIILMDESLRQLPFLFELSNSLEKNIKVNFITTMIPGFMCIGGVYLFHIGALAATLIKQSFLAIGLANSMLPKTEKFSILRNEEVINDL
ncbi:MAG: heavy metal translocating P-type ATPase [Spirochaetota bacterium]